MTTRNFTHNSKKLEGSQIYDAKVLDFSLNDIEFLKTQGKIIIFVNEEKVNKVNKEEKVNKSINPELIENLLQKIEEVKVEEVKVEEPVSEEPVSEEVKVEEPVSEELAVEEVKVEEPVSEEVKAPSKKASKKRSVNK